MNIPIIDRAGSPPLPQAARPARAASVESATSESTVASSSDTIRSSSVSAAPNSAYSLEPESSHDGWTSSEPEGQSPVNSPAPDGRHQGGAFESPEPPARRGRLQAPGAPFLNRYPDAAPDHRAAVAQLLQPEAAPAEQVGFFQAAEPRDADRFLANPHLPIVLHDQHFNGMPLVPNAQLAQVPNPFADYNQRAWTPPSPRTPVMPERRPPATPVSTPQAPPISPRPAESVGSVNQKD